MKKLDVVLVGAPRLLYKPSVEQLYLLRDYSFRVIVCGSRRWRDWRRVWAALDALYDEHGACLTVVHGDCPTGADHYARMWCNWMRLARPALAPQEQRFPADWAQYGRSAGPRRNKMMVRRGADRCEAFRLQFERSSGTDGMCRLAQQAGISTSIAYG